MTDVWAVVGATGQQGGAVVDALLEHGESVRALVRDPDKESAQALAERGVALAVADSNDGTALQQAFEGVAGVFAMTTMAGPDGVDGEVRQGRTIGDAVHAAEVSRVVYSSVGGADRGTGIPHFESKWQVEEHLRGLGLPLTVIRPVFFMENLGGGIADEDGEVVVRAPLDPDVPMQMIAVRDIGRMGATALLDPQRIPGGAIEFAGDELTPREVAAVEGDLRGLPGRFEPVPMDGLNDDQKAMFRWFRTVPSYTADLEETRRVLGSALRFREWASA